MRKLLLFVLLCAVPAWSQTTENGRVQIGAVASKPTTCTAGDQYNATDTFQVLICGPANTWVVQTGGTGANLSSDNTFTNNNRFRGPVPFVDVSAYMPAGGCSEPQGNTPPSATFSSSSTSISVSGTWATSFFNGCGVMIEGAGPTSALSAPTGLTAISHVTGGGTGINYKMVAVDRNEGVSPSTAAFNLATSDTWANLNGHHFNFISANSVANAVLYCVETDKGLGGGYFWLGCNVVPAFKDMGWIQPVPSFLPTAGTNTATAQALFTTISSGAGTTTWTVANTTSNAGTATLAYHDISTFLVSADNTIANAVGGSYVGKNAFLLIPSGLYTIAHWPVLSVSPTIMQEAVLTTANMPLDMRNLTWDGSFSSLPGPSFEPYNQAQILGTSTTPVVAIGNAFTLKRVAMSNVYGTGLYLTQGGVDLLEGTSITEVAAQKGAPVTIDGNTVEIYIDKQCVFTAGTGSDTQTEGAMVISGMTAGTMGGLSIDHSWFVNKAIWVENPAGLTGGNPMVNGILLTLINTENNNENGILNVDNGDGSTYAAVVGGYEVFFTGQDNTRNSSNNFRDLWCLNANAAGAACGAPITDINGNTTPVEGQSNPVGTDTNIWGTGMTVFNRGIYTRLGLLGVETAGNAGNCGANLDLLWADSGNHRWAMCNNNSSSYNVAEIIGAGTATMTTASITGPACGTTVTVSATGVASTDVISWAYNAAPAANPGELVISAWPTSSNVNFQYCLLSGTVTPTAATLNWKVIR